MSQILHFQTQLRQELPKVVGNLDYHIFRDQLERISEIIELGQLDLKILKCLIEEAESVKQKKSEETGAASQPISRKEIAYMKKLASSALRCTVSRGLSGESYRVFSAHVADSSLLQRFCILDNFGGVIKVPSKSTLQRYEKIVPESVVRDIVNHLSKKASEKPTEKKDQILNLQDAVSLDDYYADLSVVKTNIHFPVDWVLLLDAVRTLVKAIIWIRKSEIKNRMQDPKGFIKKMNRYAMQMTHTRRRKDSKKEQKRLLRLMKKVTITIRKHAERHRDLLKNNWESVGLKEGHVKQTLSRIEQVLSLLPQAIEQAHERIIGERTLKSQDKLLSLYEPDSNIIVRGKAGAEVEFGNKMFIGEQKNGLILDWYLYQGKAPSDSQAVIESLDRMKSVGCCPKQVTGDRGLFSKKNEKILTEKKIQNNLCPRNVVQMQKALQDGEFARHQLRRGQTEGRIGIIKNCFLGTPFRNKGFSSRNQGLSWRILTHNLWVLSRLPRIGIEDIPVPLTA